MDKFKPALESTDHFEEVSPRPKLIDSLRVLSRFIIPVGLIVFGLYHLFTQGK